MNRFLILFAMLVSTAAFSSPVYIWSCLKGDNNRLVEVKTPAGKSLPCEVIYSKPTEGLPTTRPWYANYQAEWCPEKANFLAQKLTAQGWECEHQTESLD